MKYIKRLRSVESILSTASKDAVVNAVILTPQSHAKIFRDMGFSWPLVPGEVVLPPGHLGVSCLRNTNGWQQKHRDRGKELFHYDQKWNWKMRRGGGYQHASRMVTREKERYPQTFHPPPSMELQILKRNDGSLVAAFPPIKLISSAKERLAIAMNVLIEIFGYAFLNDEVLDPIKPIRVSHWHLMSAKSRVWASVLRLVAPVAENLSESALSAASDRFETICGLRPQLCAIGQQGFLGYLVFGFPEKGLFLIDTIHSRGAICGFTANWSAVSQLSITELLDKTNFTYQLLHSTDWRNALLKRFQS